MTKAFIVSTIGPNGTAGALALSLIDAESPDGREIALGGPWLNDVGRAVLKELGVEPVSERLAQQFTDDFLAAFYGVRTHAETIRAERVQAWLARWQERVAAAVGE